MLFLRPFDLRITSDSTGECFLLSDQGARSVAEIHGGRDRNGGDRSVGALRSAVNRREPRGADCLTTERTVWPTGFAAHARRNVRDGREETRTNSHHAHYEVERYKTQTPAPDEAQARPGRGGSHRNRGVPGFLPVGEHSPWSVRQ